jgi:hypothetical protein
MDFTTNNQYSEFIGNRKFDFFSTYNPKKKLTKKMARRAIEHCMKKIQSSYPASYCYWVAEPYVLGGYHLHALFYIDAPSGRNKFSILEKAWEKYKGHKSHITYDSEKGAKYYVTKNIHKDNADYDFIPPIEKDNLQPLKLVYRKNSYIHRQIFRTDTTAIYAQLDNGRIIAYNVFKIKIQKKKESLGKIFPHKELYPSNESFGSTAWAITNPYKAFTCFYNLGVSSTKPIKGDFLRWIHKRIESDPKQRKPIIIKLY